MCVCINIYLDLPRVAEWMRRGAYTPSLRVQTAPFGMLVYISSRNISVLALRFRSHQSSPGSNCIYKAYREADTLKPSNATGVSSSVSDSSKSSTQKNCKHSKYGQFVPILRSLLCPKSHSHVPKGNCLFNDAIFEGTLAPLATAPKGIQKLCLWELLPANHMGSESHLNRFLSSPVSTENC